MDYLTRINYPKIKQRMEPYIKSAKSDIGETIGFYRGNAQYGWERGRRLAKFQNRNPIMSFIIKTISTASHTRVRSKDVTPLIGTALFSFTNPIPGMGIVGFALGRGLHQKIAVGLNKLKNIVSKIRIK